MTAPTSPTARALTAYRAHFGGEPAHLVRAPGRVNLIGEHTDYNDGFVLPMAIDRETVVAVGPAPDGRIHSLACDFGADRDAFAPQLPVAPATALWANYVRGVAQALMADGTALAGAQLAIAGDVPLGSGLSSSAALEIAVGQALVTIAGGRIDPTRLAQLAQSAENDFVGCACGIMDQLISARGRAGHALMIDCRTLACTPVALPADFAVIIAHSGVRHAHADGEYNSRRAQCELAARHYGVPALRDLSLDSLEAGRAELDPVARARARHVVSENARVIDAAAALAAGDLTGMGALMEQSHQSMRDDFAITVPAIDRLQAIMAAVTAGQCGARMTGGGFGGCVIAVTGSGQVASVVDAIARDYRDPAGNPAETFVCRAVDGVGTAQV